jgi:hypothetical protein
MKRYSDGAAGGSGANGNGGYSPGRSWKRIRVSYTYCHFILILVRFRDTGELGCFSE